MDRVLKEKTLICIKDVGLQQKMVSALKSLSYLTENLSGISEMTLAIVKSVPYKIIILEEGFQNMPLSKNAIYQEIIRMSMGLRRNIFLILLKPQTKHLDPMEAFSMSANLIMDVDKIGEEDIATILQQEISKHTKFYRVYYGARERINEGG